MTALTSKKKKKKIPPHTVSQLLLVVTVTAARAVIQQKSWPHYWGLLGLPQHTFGATLQCVPDWDGRASPQQRYVQAQEAVKGLLGFKENLHMHSSPARQMTKPSSNPTWILLSAQPHILYAWARQLLSGIVSVILRTTGKRRSSGEERETHRTISPSAWTPIKVLKADFRWHDLVSSGNCPSSSSFTQQRPLSPSPPFQVESFWKAALGQSITS